MFYPILGDTDQNLGELADRAAFRLLGRIFEMFEPVSFRWREHQRIRK